MEEPRCPKCGSDDWKSGILMVKGSLWEVAYLAGGRSKLGTKTPIVAWACQHCGFVELTLEGKFPGTPKQGQTPND